MWTVHVVVWQLFANVPFLATVNTGDANNALYYTPAQGELICFMVVWYVTIFRRYLLTSRFSFLDFIARTLADADADTTTPADAAVDAAANEAQALADLLHRRDHGARMTANDVDTIVGDPYFVLALESFLASE